MICPHENCNYESSEYGVKQHHAKTHGESLAKKEYLCDNCDKTVEKYDSDVGDVGVFCSNSCWQEYHTGENHIGWIGGKEEYTCPTCKAVFDKYESKCEGEEGPFCSDTCRGHYKTGEDSPAWSGGTTERRGDWGVKRKMALERADYTCEDPNCERIKSKCGRSLDVHHIIPNKFTDPEVHEMDNLLVLCREHHSEVEPAPRLKVSVQN